ncbi:hypothetical protein LWC35_29180 [Pseudonocardia kujensis]|uniref:hypothetical protein n=1 Tax=Pseudonocardia kujensis TaxID=1128675 RepID=UPI001E2A17DA|nr:hypothetical protein [Pseudonocardia kujensis]MCE0766949.1 hypothetical protein [Pseudonocardia kujensis]
MTDSAMTEGREVLGGTPSTGAARIRAEARSKAEAATLFIKLNVPVHPPLRHP